ncbi:hypothetical protein D0T84_20470 [Dysgonomonas sp. 521]|uniref:hypothetical protein n=1 Tax=Dysgonomonas sp. 521 TaxID=2302932 RepID=UPI0013D3B4F6|nr:hypothetical protein [Dysgonomonas sp. 521]NDV97258.1 hypothetical protein [Dysgonomonas sp. 521]
MGRYKKCRTIQKISYGVFFLYILILAVGKFSFGEYVEYVPYFITIPFILYCAVMIVTEVMVRKSKDTRLLKENRATASKFHHNL